MPISVRLPVCRGVAQHVSAVRTVATVRMRRETVLSAYQPSVRFASQRSNAQLQQHTRASCEVSAHPHSRRVNNVFFLANDSAEACNLHSFDFYTGTCSRAFVLSNAYPVVGGLFASVTTIFFAF